MGGWLGACFKWVFQVFLGMAGLVSPEEFYGFKPGEDRRLVRWDQVVEYFWMLDRASPRVGWRRWVRAPWVVL